MANRYTRQVPALAADQRDELQRWLRRSKTSQALASRARIVLACAEGGSDRDNRGRNAAPAAVRLQSNGCTGPIIPAAWAHPAVGSGTTSPRIHLDVGSGSEDSERIFATRSAPFVPVPPSSGSDSSSRRLFSLRWNSDPNHICQDLNGQPAVPATKQYRRVYPGVPRRRERVNLNKCWRKLPVVLGAATGADPVTGLVVQPISRLGPLFLRQVGFGHIASRGHRPLAPPAPVVGAPLTVTDPVTPLCVRGNRPGSGGT